MAISLLPTTQKIGSVAEEELSRAGGTISDRFDDGRRLFLRSVLPMVRHVRPGDAVQGGVALMTTDKEIRVHPYMFRQVCRNGAIVATAVQTRRVRRVESDAPMVDVEAVTEELREALRECSLPEAFRTATHQMRSATEQQADLAFHLLPFLHRLPEEWSARVFGEIERPARAGVATRASRRHLARLFAEIERRFTRERDHSRFGLMNAVTSVARDEPDPEVRWRLEELGGGIAALSPPNRKPGGAAAEMLPVSRLVAEAAIQRVRHRISPLGAPPSRVQATVAVGQPGGQTSLVPWPGETEPSAPEW